MNILLGILLGILKVLLLVLVLLLIIVLLLLAVPFRYRIRGRTKDGQFEVSASLSWLMHAVTAVFEIEKNGETLQKQLDVRIFGISLREMHRKKQQKKKERSKRRKKQKLDELKRQDPKQYEQMKKAALERRKQREAVAAEEAAAEKSAASVPREAEQTVAEEENLCSRVRKKLTETSGKFIKKLRAGFEKLFATFIDILLKAVQVPQYVSGKAAQLSGDAGRKITAFLRWAEFLTGEEFLTALSEAKRLLLRLLLHIRPREVKADFLFGLEDPALTGELLGIGCALGARYGDRVRLAADFEEKKLEGEAEIAGRIILGVLLCAFCAAIMNRNVRSVIHTFRNSVKEEE